MKKTVAIPEGVKISIDGFKVSVNGEKEKLERDFYSPLFFRKIKIEEDGDNIVISSEVDKRKVKAEVGSITAHIKNMIKGVTEGFHYEMKISYVHFPMTVKVEGDMVTVNNFLGEKNPRKAYILGDTKVEIKKDVIVVSGANNESVGQTCANIETCTKISSRDRRIYQDGIFIVSKG